MFWVTAAVFAGYNVVFLVVAVHKKRREARKLYMTSRAMQQYNHGRKEKMEVQWRKEKRIGYLGSNWLCYTPNPDKLIAVSNTMRGNEFMARVSTKML